MNLTEALCFDDILILPQHSYIKSRKDIDLTMSAGGIKLDIPIIAAPMDTVCGDSMAIELSKRGALGVIHRYQSLNDQIRMIQRVKSNWYTCFGSIGINGDYLSDAKKLINAGATGICIDVANGHNFYAIEAVKKLRSEFDIHIMTGNVSTAEGFIDLANAGANSVRVGIGGGSMCTTRIITGHGLPTLQTIMDIEQAAYNTDCAIIADGGIRNTGDMLKAFAVGADFVMVGSMLAGTTESPGEVVNGKKIFRGMASFSAQEENRGKISVVEGAETTIDYKGNVSNIIDQIVGGLKSGCSYSGVEKLKFLSSVAKIRRISSNSIQENRPHGV